MGKSAVIVYAKRTALGKFCGAFANTPAPQLGAALVKNALATLPLKGEDVDEIIMGQVLQAGSGQAPARQSALLGGLPTSVAALTVNKVCGSGMKSVMLAAQAISSGETLTAFAGGQENMSLAPHLLMKSRSGYRMGPVEVLDHMQWDGLTDPYKNIAMGVCGEACAKEFRITREEQDAYALESYERARNANDSGSFQDEILPLEVKNGKQVMTVNKDEDPFAVDLGKFSTLRPVFDKDGTITAGNASTLSDGAALLVLMEEEHARKKGLKPLARIVASSTHAQDPMWFTTAPVKGIRKLLSKAALNIRDIDLFEINEAFSVVPLVAMKQLGLPKKNVNVRGGAVALGHPIGASGARILVTLLHALHAEGKKRGVASICIGGGEACSLLLETIYSI